MFCVIMKSIRWQLVITKDLASAKFVHKMLADRGEKATLIATASV